MLGLVEHSVANNQGDNCPNHAKSKRKHGGRRVKQEDIAHELQVVVHGIHNNQHLNPMGHLANVIGGPEDRRQVHPCGDNDGPQVHNIAEEYGKRREHHAQAHAKAHKQKQANRQQD